MVAGGHLGRTLAAARGNCLSHKGFSGHRRIKALVELRIRRLGVRIPPSARSPNGSPAHRRSRHEARSPREGNVLQTVDPLRRDRLLPTERPCEGSNSCRDRDPPGPCTLGSVGRLASSADPRRADRPGVRRAFARRVPSGAVQQRRYLPRGSGAAHHSGRRRGVLARRLPITTDHAPEEGRSGDRRARHPEQPGACCVRRPARSPDRPRDTSSPCA
jgi:hypothetical protein